MASLYDVGAWCPQCGDEYRPGFTVCADCHVQLVYEKPPQPSPWDDKNHDLVVYELQRWTADDRAGLDLLLTGAEIAHRWDDGNLLVPRARQLDVADLVATVQTVGDAAHTSETTTPIRGGAGAARTGDRGRQQRTATQYLVAGDGRRVIGASIDALGTLLWYALFAVLFGWPAQAGLAARSAGMLLSAAYWVPSVAISGRTVGKLLAGTRVALRGDGAALPGWRRATIRWAIPSLLGFASLAMFSGSHPSIGLTYLSLGWDVAVYGAILTNPFRQGLHDRAAGTVVVRSKSPKRQAGDDGEHDPQRDGGEQDERPRRS